MNEAIRDVNPLRFLLEKIKENSKWYDKARIKAVLFREKDLTYLYDAEVNFLHKLDNILDDEIHDYGKAVLLTWKINIEKLIEFINTLSSGTVSIKDLKDIKITGSFTDSCYHISSRNRYAGVYNEWPFWLVQFSAVQNSQIHYMGMYENLTALGNPPYPNIMEATQTFLNLENMPNVNTPIGIAFKIPDYRARINILEIAETHISVTTEQRETKKENLVVQFYCKKGEKNAHPSTDMQLDENGTAELICPFNPDFVQVYLLEKKTGSIVDLKTYGKWYTDRNDGVIVKTPKETVEAMIAKGEDQSVEFKLDLGKTEEFLESIVAFANTKGGTILIGVYDDGRVVGLDEDFDKTEKKIRNLVTGRCKPDIDIQVEQIIVDNRTIVVVTVKEGKDKPYLLVGKSGYKRVNKDDYVLERTDFDNIYSQKNMQRNSHSSSFV